jgi:CheY-like chemotaxis protein
MAPKVDSPLVLVVEDTEDVAAALSELLAEAGYRVIGAENGIDAVDTAVRLIPDLILMDLSLPLMGGVEASKLLKKDSRTCDIPIVVLTGHRSFLGDAREAGCDAFLIKPCPPAQLLAEVQKLAGAPARARKVRPTDN